MNLYFAGSIRGGRSDQATYHRLIEHLKKFGTVYTEHVGLDEPEDRISSELNDIDIHDRDMSWLSEAHAVIAEVTVPSLGVGYEIGRAVEQKIPVLCLFRPGKDNNLSAMISGSPHLNLVEYNTFHEACTAIDLFLEHCVPVQ